MKLSKLEKEYLDLVDKQVLLSWASIAKWCNESEEELINKYKTIENYIAVRFGEPKEKEHIKECLELKDRYREKIKSFKSLVEFCEWYFSKGQKCYYCGITQDKLDKLFDGSKGRAKIPAKKHTARLQIERKDPDAGYNAKNCELACSLCNNAKSDMISAENYKKFFGEKMGEFLESLYEGKIKN